MLLSTEKPTAWKRSQGHEPVSPLTHPTPPGGSRHEASKERKKVQFRLTSLLEKVRFEPSRAKESSILIHPYPPEKKQQAPPDGFRLPRLAPSPVRRRHKLQRWANLVWKGVHEGGGEVVEACAARREDGHAPRDW